MKTFPIAVNKAPMSLSMYCVWTRSSRFVSKWYWSSLDNQAGNENEESAETAAEAEVDFEKARSARERSDESLLQRWAAIAGFLGQPVAAAQRWAKDGMPVQRKGRSIAASAQELSVWLAREAGAGAPVHLVLESDEDLLQELRRGLKEARTLRKE